MKKPYISPELTTHYNDLSISIAMASVWEPGDGNPSGGGNNGNGNGHGQGGRPKDAYSTAFGGESPFPDNHFSSSPFE